MVYRKVMGLLIVCLLAGSTLAVSTELTVNSGRVRVKKATNAEWQTVTEKVSLESGDSLTLGDTPTAEATLDGSVSLGLKNGCSLVFFAKETKLSLTILGGQLLFKKEDGPGNKSLEFRAEKCLFTPVGTAAAIKITAERNPSVAVVEGTMRMTKPDGAAQDVGAGSFCTFQKEGNSFSQVKELPPAALESLKSWVATVSKKASDQSSLFEEVDEAEAKDETAQSAAFPLEPAATSKPEPTPVVEETPQTTSQTPTPVTPPVEKKEEPVVKETKPEPPKEQEKKSTEQPTESATVSPTPTPEEPKKEEEPQSEAEKKESGDKKAPDQPAWEVSAGMVTVDNEQWTRLAIAVDVPIWRFGVCFDLEVFLNSQGNFSNKGWDFQDGKEAARSLSRKIRYIRFNKSGDPFYTKLGGLDNVTFGYGFVVDRFTNMLAYPDKKLLGLELEVNDVSPIGLSLQALVPDFMDFANDGGILAGKIGFKPFKKTEAPVLSWMSISGMIASDLNQYAQARDWDYDLEGEKWDRDMDGRTDSTYLYNTYHTLDGYNDIVMLHRVNEDYDTKVEHADQWAKDTTDPVTIVGADIIIPIVKTKLLQLDLYAQGGVTLDDEDDDNLYKGWGIGAPGVGLKVGPVLASLEYRHIRDRFVPGYFNTYYLRDRITRNPIVVKEHTLDSANLNGVFGQIGFNIKNAIILDARYQMLLGPEVDSSEISYYKQYENFDTSANRIKDQRFNGTLRIGDVILERIPKVNMVEAFYDQNLIVNNNFFYQSPHTYWGYRLGCEVVAGTFIIWETRYGWIWSDETHTELLDDKTVTIKAGLSF